MHHQYNINIGIWVDHKQAYLVRVENDKSNVLKIESQLERHHRSAGGTRSKRFTGEISSESKYENKFQHHLAGYYDKIIESIGKIENPDTILLFGPGRAKRELLKRMENSPLNKVKIAGIITVDKMTENQIIAYVKDFFTVKQSKKTT